MPSDGITLRGGLEEVHHRVALDVIATAEQERALRVVQAFLLDQRRQLGIAHVGALSQVAVRVVVVEERDRDDAAAVVGAIADQASIQGAVSIRALVGGCRCAVIRGHKGIDSVEHVAPVGDVGHVLEGSVAITAGRGQEFVGANVVGAVHVQRFAGLGALVDHAVVKSAPGIGLRAGLVSSL